MPRQDDRTKYQDNTAGGDDVQGRHGESEPKRGDNQKPHKHGRQSRLGGCTGRGSLCAEKVGHFEEGLHQDVAPSRELLECLDDLVQRLLMLGACDFRSCPLVFDGLFLRRTRIICLGRTRRGRCARVERRIFMRSGRISPAAAAQGTVSPAIHAGNECYSDDDRARSPNHDVSIEHSEPKGGQKQEALPGVAGAPCEQAEKCIQGQQERVAIGEGARYLWRCGEQQRALLVDKDVGAASGSRGVGGQGNGRKAGVSRWQPGGRCRTLRLVSRGRGGVVA